LRGLAVDAGVRGCAEVRSHISETRYGAPGVMDSWNGKPMTYCAKNALQQDLH
jgi:hypothetical protein